jgi:hypothetical protein
MSGGDTVCKWTMVVNILINQSWADNKGWSSTLGIEFECSELTAMERMLQIATQGLTFGARIIDGLV